MAMKQDLDDIFGDHQLFIGEATYPLDAEITDWHINQWFLRQCEPCITWCDQRNLNMRYQRRIEPTANKGHAIIRWYAGFPSLETMVEFMLSASMQIKREHS